MPATGCYHPLMVSRSTVDVVASAIGGWLAPDGRIWRCEDRHHEDAAEFLVRHLGLRSDRDAGDVLVDARWLRISDNGLVLGARYPTQVQFDVLFDLARTHRTMRRRLMDELERARERSVPKTTPR
jgi:hypothetical protein